MVKDPLDEGRTQELPFDAVEEHVKGSQTIAEIAEQVLATPELEPTLGDDLHDLFVEPVVTKIVEGATVKVSGASPKFNGEYVVEAVSPPQTPVEPAEEWESEFPQMDSGLVESALKMIRSRSFSARNPHLGKMIKCHVCGLRHRAAPKQASEDGPITYETSCVQKFTNVKGKFEYFREEPKTGTLVPDLRTAIDPDVQPTPRQIVGAAAFAKRRFNPHPSATKLQLIERTRKVFKEMGFTITEGEQAQKNMEQARGEAKLQLRREARKRKHAVSKRQRSSRRINRGV